MARQSKELYQRQLNPHVAKVPADLLADSALESIYNMKSILANLDPVTKIEVVAHTKAVSAKASHEFEAISAPLHAVKGHCQTEDCIAQVNDIKFVPKLSPAFTGNV